MSRPLGPTPADELGADLGPVWDRLVDHADAAPPAAPELRARVLGTLNAEFDRALRPTALRPVVVIRPLFRPSSLRSLTAAAALVALLGAGVALAGAGVATLNQAPAVLPTPTPTEEQATDDADDTESPAPVVQPPVRPTPDEDTDDDEGTETPEPDDEDSEDRDADESPEPDDRDEDETEDPDDDGDDEPNDDGDSDADEPEDDDRES